MPMESVKGQKIDDIYRVIGPDGISFYVTIKSTGGRPGHIIANTEITIGSEVRSIQLRQGGSLREIVKDYHIGITENARRKGRYISILYKVPDGTDITYSKKDGENIEDLLDRI